MIVEAIIFADEKSYKLITVNSQKMSSLSNTIAQTNILHFGINQKWTNEDIIALFCFAIIVVVGL